MIRPRRVSPSLAPFTGQESSPLSIFPQRVAFLRGRFALVDAHDVTVGVDGERDGIVLPVVQPDDEPLAAVPPPGGVERTAACPTSPLDGDPRLHRRERF